MGPAITIWFSLWVSILVFALNLQVLAATILNHPNLERKICRIAYSCLGFGLLFLLVGLLLLFYFKLNSWTSWVSTGTVLVISVALPLIVQAEAKKLTEDKLEVGDKLKKFGQNLDTISRRLAWAAAIIIIISAIAFVILKCLAIL